MREGKNRHTKGPSDLLRPLPFRKSPAPETTITEVSGTPLAHLRMQSPIAQAAVNARDGGP
jgi:hypothetical protein